MASPDTTIDFYWRPGCFFCSRLERELDRRGLPLHKLNIWDDQRNAAVVRGVTGGNETVPTVVVGDESMVNPSPDEVVEAVRRHAPHLLSGAATGD